MNDLLEKQKIDFSINGFQLDLIDFKLILETQAGIPIVSNPFELIANNVGVTEEDVMSRLQKFKDSGFIRKMAGTPNHYKIGYTANAMTVWDIPDDFIDEVGNIFKSAKFVSHCYVRPRILPEWTFNFFAMIHGKKREEVELKVETLKNLILHKYESFDLIYSTQILKKTGIRIKDKIDV